MAVEMVPTTVPQVAERVWAVSGEPMAVETAVAMGMNAATEPVTDVPLLVETAVETAMDAATVLVTAAQLLVETAVEMAMVAATVLATTAVQPIPVVPLLVATHAAPRPARVLVRSLS